MNANPTRADDEILLAWLQLRDEGVTSKRIAEMYGVTDTRVRTATNRVRAAK